MNRNVNLRTLVIMVISIFASDLLADYGHHGHHENGKGHHEEHRGRRSHRGSRREHGEGRGGRHGHARGERRHGHGHHGKHGHGNRAEAPHGEASENMSEAGEETAE